MSDKQQRRAEILTRLASSSLTVPQAAGLLGVSERQVRRLRERFAWEGLSSVVHKNTGRTPLNKTPAEVRTKLKELAGKDGRYHDFNTSHLQEMLAQEEELSLGRSTLDRLLVEEGIRKRRRSRPRRLFGRRERRARAGEMLLTDGSTHDWLEGRDARHRRLCLMGSIDDATSQVLHLRFWPTECQAGYIRMAREVTVAHGIPMSFYHDRHTMLCSPKDPTIEDELAGREPMSQWQAILAALGAEAIAALTPQAKGRVERLWRTLQDRLIKEMRLAGVDTLEEANTFLATTEFLPRFNARFGVPAREPQPAWVAASDPKDHADLDLSYYFAVKEERTVRADHTLSWKGQTFQISRRRADRSLAGTRVMVHTTPEGETHLYAGKQRLIYSLVDDAASAAKTDGPANPERREGRKKVQQKKTEPKQDVKPPQEAKATQNAGRRGWLYATT